MGAFIVNIMVILFSLELVKKDRFPIFFITYFAFYFNDCIIIIIIIIITIIIITE